jgi:DNA-binding response OmpR family regulator
MSYARRILVADDNAVISFFVEDEIEAAGCVAVGPFSSCKAASSWLSADTPDAAVLDIQLTDGHCDELALLLRERGVPFIVFSGMDRAAVHPVFKDVLWVSKPCANGDLEKALRALLNLPQMAEP